MQHAIGCVCSYESGAVARRSLMRGLLSLDGGRPADSSQSGGFFSAFVCCREPLGLPPSLPPRAESRGWNARQMMFLPRQLPLKTSAVSPCPSVTLLLPLTLFLDDGLGRAGRTWTVKKRPPTAAAAVLPGSYSRRGVGSCGRRHERPRRRELEPGDSRAPG